MPSLISSVDKPDPRCIVAEFIGTFLFQFLGGAAIATASTCHGWECVVSAALGNGLAMAVCVYMTAKVSGGHLNPAISTAFAACNLPSFGRRTYLSYLVAQILGACLGAVMLFLALPAELMVGHHGFGSFTTLGILSERHPMTVFFGELACTTALVFTVFGVVHSYNFGPAGPLAIGLAQMAGYFAIGPYSGGSLNPARTVAGILVFGFGKLSWVYFLQLLAIFGAGYFGGKAYKKLFLPSE